MHCIILSCILSLVYCFSSVDENRVQIYNGLHRDIHHAPWTSSITLPSLYAAYKSFASSLDIPQKIDLLKLKYVPHFQASPPISFPTLFYWIIIFSFNSRPMIFSNSISFALIIYFTSNIPYLIFWSFISFLRFYWKRKWLFFIYKKEFMRNENVESNYIINLYTT